MRKTRIIICILASLLLIPVHITAKGNFWKSLGKAFLGAAVGYAEKSVEKYVPTEQKETYEKMKSDINSSLRVDQSFVNAGNNWQQKKKSDAILDFTEGVTSIAGISDNVVTTTMLGLARAQNNYHNNINSGMSKSEALMHRDEDIKNCASGVFNKVYDDFNARQTAILTGSDSLQTAHKMLHSEATYRQAIWQEMLNRGYNMLEARLYMTFFEENPGMLSSMWDESAFMTTIKIELDQELQEKIHNRAQTILNNFNIADRTSSSPQKDSHVNENNFFGTDLTPEVLPTTQPNSNGTTPSPVIHTPEVSPLEKAKSRLTEIAPDHYNINSVGLNDIQRKTLDEVISLMNEFPDIRICLNGNTCDLGTNRINMLVGSKRAINAKNYLVSKGIDSNRIEVDSSGSSNPVNGNHTKEARLQNRRVSITIIN